MNKRFTLLSFASLVFGFAIVIEAFAMFKEPGFVFSASATEKACGAGLHCLFLDGGAPYWTPSQVEIDELEARLPDYLAVQAESFAQLKDISNKIDSYGRQYLGFTESDTKRIIFINAFCNRWGKTDIQLQHELVRVKDGGECYFHLFYDLQEKSFSGLQVNGEA